MNLNLKNKTVLFLAKRNSGKSVMMKYLLGQYKHVYDKIFVVCPSEKINKFYADIVPDNCIMESWSETWVSTLIKTLTDYKENNKKEMNVLLLLDDCVTDVRFHESKSFKQLFSRGRHFFCSIWISSQNLTSIPPLARGNSDYIITGQLSNKSVHLLCDEYIAGNIDKKSFLDLYHRATQDYSFLIINNNSVENAEDLNQIYAIFKTPM